MLLLPRHFHPTHETAGLPGFPAIDVFAKAGTPVGCEFAGTVIKLSGHPTTPTAQPGGPYGWSTYVGLGWDAVAREWRDVYYITHQGSRTVKLGDRIAKGEKIGTVANYSAATHGVTPSHIHLGFHEGIWRP